MYAQLIRVVLVASLVLMGQASRLVAQSAPVLMPPAASNTPQEIRISPGDGAAEKGEERRERAALFAIFDDGVLLSTRDEEFQLRIHVMEQTDYKLFLPTYQVPARSGAYIPRFRAYFEGRVTRSFDYEVSLQRSVEGSFDVLDANINFRPSDAIQLKVGRFLVPYSYEWFDHLEQYFIAPERSLFPLNFGLSREAGVMLWGKVLDERVQYALGGFAGQLSGLADNNTSRDVVGYINARPFLLQNDVPALRYFNIGGSLAIGRQAFAESPLPMRTSIQASENDEAAQSASSTFLEFNDGVSSFGSGRISGAVHMAWYVNQFSLEAEWQAGMFPYVKAGDAPVKVPVHGYGIAAGYFVTGETVEGRKVVIPLRPFDPVSGQTGPGAIELFARYSALTLGDEVFSAGLANPDLWTRQARMTDLGFHWHPNRFLRFTFDWQHTMFGTPVMLNEAQGKAGRSVDLFWARCQVWF